MKIFVDTWGWLALQDRRELSHQQVIAFYREARLNRARFYTSDYVLDETFTLLGKRLPFIHTQSFMKLIGQATLQGYLDLLWITPNRFHATQALRLKYQDKPNISFTDLSSMVLMSELDIPFILTRDAHFTHVGLGFELVP